MRNTYGHQQPRTLVRIGAALRCFYSFFSGIALAVFVVASAATVNSHAAIYEVAPSYWTTDLGYPYPQGATFSAVVETSCQRWFDGLIYGIARTEIKTLYDGIQRACFARIQNPGLADSIGQSVYFKPVPTCESGTTFEYAGVTYDQGKCRKVSCPIVTTQCFMKSTTGALSVPAASCTNGCLVANQLGGAQERYEGGQMVYWYPLTRVADGGACNTSSYAAPSCSGSTPPPQDPCLMPGAATSPSCGGGSGCPTGTTMLANGACTANDANSPCVLPNSRNAQGVCVPFIGGTGGGGTGTGDAGAGGTGGNSGATGGAGGNGGAGSATGGGGGGSGGQGGGGGSGGGAGSGGAGGTGGAAGKAAECGPGKMLCEDTFADYATKVKEFFAGDPSETAQGKAELAKSRAGGYDENKMTKGPVTDLSSLRLDTGGGMIGGGRSCPSARSINLRGHTVAISYQPLCDFSGYIRAVLLALCALVSARIVFGAWS